MANHSLRPRYARTHRAAKRLSATKHILIESDGSGCEGEREMEDGETETVAWRGYGRRFNSLFDFRRNLCCKLLIRFSCKRIQKSYFTFGLFFVPLFLRTFRIWLPNRFRSFPMVLLYENPVKFFFLTFTRLSLCLRIRMCVCVSFLQCFVSHKRYICMHIESWDTRP